MNENEISEAWERYKQDMKIQSAQTSAQSNAGGQIQAGMGCTILAPTALTYDNIQPMEGDVVRLRSGGPSLTVIEVQKGFLLCVGMQHDGLMYEHTLPKVALYKIA